MLIVEAVNISKLTENSDYTVRVRINEKVIWSGKVYAHTRSNGASTLLRKIALAMDTDDRKR